MDKQETMLIKRITHEYVDFMKKTSGLVDEVKRATVFSLKKALKLEDGSSIYVNEDGSLDIELKKDSEKSGVKLDGDGSCVKK